MASASTGSKAGQEKMEQHKENLQNKGSQIGKDVREFTSEAQAAASDQLHQVGDLANEYIQRGRDEMLEVTESLEEQIRTQPIRSVLVAAGVGFMFGLVLLRR